MYHQVQRLKIIGGAHTHVTFVCRLWISEQTATVTAVTDWFCISEVESVYFAVCTDSLYKLGMFCL